MGDNHSHLSLYGKPPLYQLFVSLLIILVVGMFLFLVFYLAGTLIFDGDFGNLLENLSPEVGEKGIIFLRYLLISQGISLFIVPAIIILTLMKPGHQNSLIAVIPAIGEELIFRGVFRRFL